MTCRDVHVCVIHSAVKSFTELGPKLLAIRGVEYLLSEVFSQDPLECYFSKQCHRGGSNENPTVEQVPLSTMTLVQHQSIYRDLKTMSIEQDCSPNCSSSYATSEVVYATSEAT